jgi:SHS2 domain-containing protein
MTHHSLPHTADIRIAFDTPTFGALLQEGVVVMRQLLAGDAVVEPRESRSLAVPGHEPAELFFGFLRELLFQAATEGFLPATFEPHESGAPGIRGELAGERIDPDRHEPQPEVKAITRHGFVVERRGDGWYAEVVFDV